MRVPWMALSSGSSSSCPYSPECVEGKFSELRLSRILRSSTLFSRNFRS